jgi:hypothetical chaperone protein
MEVERAKIELSELSEADIPLDWIESGLSVHIDRPGLVAATDVLSGRLHATVLDCVRQAGIRPQDIDVLFLTGGSTRLRHARAAIVAAVPSARIVEGDTFGSVGLGLTIQATRRYGTDRERECCLKRSGGS